MLQYLDLSKRKSSEEFCTNDDNAVMNLKPRSIRTK